MVTLEEVNEAHQIGPYQPYQKEIINYREGSMCILIGRKGGKTEALEARDAMMLLNERIPGTALNGGIGFVTVAGQEAKRFLNGIAGILQNLGWTPVKDWVAVSQEDKTFFWIVNEIRMPNLNRILAFKAGHDGRTIRPYSVHEMQVDEADLGIADAVFESISPCCARYQAPMILSSTINRAGLKTTYFGRAFFGRLPGFKVWDIPTTQAPHISPKWLAEELERYLADHTKGRIAFEREYLNKWASTANAVFPQQAISACTAPQKWFYEDMIDKGELYVGQDYARYGADLNVTAYNNFFDGISHVHCKFRSSDWSTTEIARELHNELKDKANLKLIVTDESNMGAGTTDALIDLFGSYRVRGIMNNQRVDAPEGVKSRFIKADLYSLAAKLMAEGKVQFNVDNRIAHSLVSMQWYYTKRGDLSVFGNDNHAAEAIVRALYPVFSKSRNTNYEPGMISGLNSDGDNEE